MNMYNTARTNLLGLIKTSSSSDKVNEIIDDARKVLDVYSANPNEVNKEKLIDAIKYVYATDPAKTRNVWFAGAGLEDLASAGLQLQRKNIGRGLARSFFVTPMNLMTSMANDPIRLLGRALDPNVNTLSYNINDLLDETDPEKIRKGADELLRNKAIDKADPHDYFEHTKNYLNRYKVSVPEAIATLPTGLVGLATDLLGMPGAIYHSVVEGDTSAEDEKVNEKIENRVKKLFNLKKNRK